MAEKQSEKELGGLSLGIILLGKDGKVVNVSKAADHILQTNPLSIRIVKQSLVLKTERLNRQLKAIISAAIEPYQEEPDLHGGAITLWSDDRQINQEQANCNARIELLISPFNAVYSETTLLASSTGALVFLKSYGKQVIPPSAKILADLYDLTITEVDVCQAMMENLNTEEIADRMSVGKEAVRFHYKKLYKKLAIRGQSELVQLIATSVAGITCDA